MRRGRWPRLLACTVLLAVPVLAGAQQVGPGAAPPEELRVAVARRLRQLTGMEVRIGELRYEILGSRFVGSDLQVGPHRDPMLRIGDLSAELSLLSTGGGTLKIQRVELTGVRARLPAGWLGRPLPRRAHGAAQVRAARVVGTVELLGETGTATLSGLELEVRDLELGAAGEGDPPELTGAVLVRARRLALGTLAFEGVELEGRLERDRLVVERLEAELLGAKLKLRGRLGYGDKRPGPLELHGSLGGSLRGRVRLSGRSLSALLLEGTLSGKAPARQSGALAPAPAVRLRVRLGGRELRGTAASWQIR